MSFALRTRISITCLALGLLIPFPARAWQDDLVVRPEPPRLDDFETDEDGDKVPDGWYNLRDASLATGGPVGPTVLRFENDLPGRPARASRAFGINGREYEAVILGLWVRVEDVHAGERLGEAPSLLIDFLGGELKAESRSILGPWTDLPSGQWTHVAKRIPIREPTLDAILSVGLIGGTGRLDIDGLSIELVPRGGAPSTNLVLNGDVELGDPDPDVWELNGEARRAFPGHRSDSCLVLERAGSQAQVPLSVPLRQVETLDLSLSARASGLRGAGSAVGDVYFLDVDGRILPGEWGGVRAFRWSGTFDWQPFRARAAVPRSAVRAVFQIEKSDSIGSISIDDVRIEASPLPDVAEWTPYHSSTDTDGWHPYKAEDHVEPGSALDASHCLDAPAGRHGPVTVEGAHLVFEDKTPARFFGVDLLPPMAVVEPDRADRLADQLARRGVNLVRFVDIDAPIGPGRSLLDDTAEDTVTIDPLNLERFDHLVSALEKRGIYLSIEFNSTRLLRSKDNVPGGRHLPPGGGPAAAFDPSMETLVLQFARNLLGHKNPETGRALRDDPALVWVCLSGERSLFDLLDDPNALPPESAEELRKLARKNPHGSGRRFWQSTESKQWASMARSLREWGLKTPVAGCSHWRRESEFVAAQAIGDLDVIDDRLYWAPPRFAGNERASMLWRSEGSLMAEAARKRQRDRPYMVSQWCDFTGAAWALPYEGADLLFAAEAAANEKWDALVRRGIFLEPETWGAAATGTSGGRDIFALPEILNGNPQAFSLLPHAASIVLHLDPDEGRSPRRHATWDASSGRLAIDTPFTQAVAGWSGRSTDFASISIDPSNGYSVVAVSSVGADPIASADRLLVTAVARVEPTGLTYVDPFQRAVAAPGTPPLVCEPVRARITWRHRGPIKAYALDNAGRRVGPVALQPAPEGAVLELDGSSPHLHFELSAGAD